MSQVTQGTQVIDNEGTFARIADVMSHMGEFTHVSQMRVEAHDGDMVIDTVIVAHVNTMHVHTFATYINDGIGGIEHISIGHINIA